MRKARPQDVDLLVGFMAEFYAEGNYPLNPQRAAQAFEALLADERLGKAWLVQAGLRDVGHVVVTYCHSMEYGGLIAFVDDLFVQQPFRGKGLGTAALEEVRTSSAKRGIRAIFVETGQDNAAAQVVYRRAGFVNTDRLLLALALAEPTQAA